ncbi:MAG: serine--tRNA ligase [Candidatus Hinthialibacter antarcticus]|nr:serine--tRNA ligase [Candidatus Hinthialibacter antarcticus]
MLDLKVIREKPEWVEAELRRREPGVSLNAIVELDANRRALQTETDEMRSKQNAVTDQIAVLKKDKQDASAVIAEMKQLSEQIKEKTVQLRELETQLDMKVAELPNLPHESVPTDMDKANNQVVHTFGEKPQFSFQPKNHLELGKSLQLFDFERGAKITGSHFPLYWGQGAQLEWALLNFFREHNQKRGYIPVVPPLLLNRDTTFASGNLPKFEDQLYKCKDDPFYLLPTSEVPLTSMFRDEILNEDDLPLMYTSVTPCFRREAGAHGAEERGLVRMHQFNKCEMYKYTTPETSYDELEALVKDAQHILEELGLHYQSMLLVTGDIGNQAAKTYDLEVWLPGQDSYYEVSSCSNCEDYQGRRGNIRYRPKDGGKPRFVHTLNGSGLATPRLMIAVLENNQQEDGSVIVPEALRPYMSGLEVLEPKG